MGKEIISLQIGPYSNYVGSHWWNQQELYRVDDGISTENGEDLEHEILFREVVDPMHSNTLAYVPRTIIIDSKQSISNNFGLVENLPTENELGSNVQVYKQEELKNNSFLESLKSNNTTTNSSPLGNIPLKNYHLEDNVRSWSEYLGLKYHPKSLQFVQNNFSASDDESLSTFIDGSDLFKMENFVDGLDDSLHYFAEECDSLQGFQVFGDTADSYGGLTNETVMYIRDEYGKKSVITYAMWNGWDSNTSIGERYLTMENTFQSFVSLPVNSDLVIPLSLTESFGVKDTVRGRSFKHLNYKLDNKFQTSGILSSAVDLLSLPYRLKSSKMLLSDFCHSINYMGHRIANVDISLPYHLQTSQVSYNTNHQPLLPSLISTKSDTFTTHTCIRNVDDVVEVLPKRLRSMELDQRNAHNGLESDTKGQQTITSRLLSTKPPYPQIFTSDISEDGSFLAHENRPSNQIVTAIPCSTMLSTSRDMFEPLSLISKCASDAHKSKSCPSQVDREQFDDLNESYSTLISKYSS